jgi:hypothetical protein
VVFFSPLGVYFPILSEVNACVLELVLDAPIVRPGEHPPLGPAPDRASECVALWKSGNSHSDLNARNCVLHGKMPNLRRVLTPRKQVSSPPAGWLR